MSKAFTREDDAGLDPAKTDPPKRFQPHTRMGHAIWLEELARAKRDRDDARAAAIEARIAAGTIDPPADSALAGLGAEVTLCDAQGGERVVRLVTPDEVGLVPRGATTGSPIGRALVGSRVGDAVSVGDSSAGEFSVVTIAWPGDGAS